MVFRDLITTEVDELGDTRLFDAEEVGHLLRRIGGLPQLGDFQHHRAWRLAQLSAYESALPRPTEAGEIIYTMTRSAGEVAADIRRRRSLLHEPPALGGQKGRHRAASAR